jgi:gas vesicle protein
MSDTSKIIIAALAGAAVGAVAALLLAPASGKETREKLKEKFGEAKDKISDMLGKRAEEVTKKTKEETA